MPVKILKSKRRTLEQLREYYEIEKELASRLRNASRKDRRHLYRVLYDEFYQRIPRLSTRRSEIVVSRKMKLLKRFLNPESTFLEVGSGDCSLALEVAKRVRKVYAIEVSEEVTRNRIFPQNFELTLSDGFSIPVPENSINTAYSESVMEHVHPDDAFDHVQNIYRALVPGGVYVCFTPNRLSGPHDISKYFDKVATGFHLKEYTATELCNLFHKVGFSKISTYIGGRGIYIRCPLSFISLCERRLVILPFSLRKLIANTLPFKALLGIRVVGKK